MEGNMKYFMRSVCFCVKQKKLINSKGSVLKTIPSAAPLELVSINFEHLDTCTGRYQYLLIITVNVWRFIQAHPTHNAEAKATAEEQ